MTEAGQKFPYEPPVEAIGSYFAEMHDQIKENLKKNPQGLICGPVFFTETMKGQALQLTPYRFYLPYGLNKLFLFTQDLSTGEVLGGRHTSLSNFGNLIHAGGYMFFSSRGAGFAVPTELASRYLLQQEANIHGIPVRCAAVETFQDFRQSERWEHIWGGTGVLGFNEEPLHKRDSHRCVKEIPPNKDLIDIDNYASITFRRVSETVGGREMATGIIVASEAIPNPVLQQQKLTDILSNFLLPQLDKIAQILSKK